MELKEGYDKLMEYKSILDEKKKLFFEYTKEGKSEEAGKIFNELLGVCGKCLQICNHVLNNKIAPDLEKKVKESEKNEPTIIAIPKNPRIH